MLEENSKEISVQPTIDELRNLRDALDGYLSVVQGAVPTGNIARHISALIQHLDIEANGVIELQKARREDPENGMNEYQQLERGDVVFAQIPYMTIGSEKRKPRPVLVMQASCKKSTTLIVCPVTTGKVKEGILVKIHDWKPKGNIPLNPDSQVDVGQIMTLSRARLEKTPRAHLSAENMKEVEQALCKRLGLLSREVKLEQEVQKQRARADAKDIRLKRWREQAIEVLNLLVRERNRSADLETNLLNEAIGKLEESLNS